MVTIPQYVGQTRAGLGTGGSRSREQDKNLVRTVGDSLGQLAQVMAKINQRADQAHIDDAVGQYIEWDTDYHINDISARKGAGVSTDLIREAKEARQKKIDELADGLSPRAQAELKRQLQREYLSGQTYR
jgi:hypothetical protein